MNVLVILHSGSGRGDHGEVRASVESWLTGVGADFEVRETAAQGDARRWAREADHDVVVVAGGDGTIMEAMSGLIESGRGIPLAQIPGGTANLLAKALGISRDVEQALETAVGGVAVAMDVGYLPDLDRYFSLVAGAGWDAQLIGDASTLLKRKLGRLAYVATGVKNLFALQRSRITVVIDGKRRRFRAHTVIVFNVGGFTDGGFALGRDIDPHDGKLDVAVISARGFGDLLRLAFRLLVRQYQNYRGLTYFSASSVRIEARPPLAVQIDGDTIGETPMLVRVLPGAAVLVVPPAYAAAHGLEDVRPTQPRVALAS